MSFGKLIKKQLKKGVLKNISGGLKLLTSRCFRKHFSLAEADVAQQDDVDIASEQHAKSSVKTTKQSLQSRYTAKFPHLF